MWMREAGLLAKRRQDLWRRRLVEIEQPGSAGSEPVRQEVVVGRHRLFRVMRERAAFADRNRRNDGAVFRRGGIGIDDAEKITGLPFLVAGPNEEIRTRGP